MRRLLSLTYSLSDTRRALRESLSRNLRVRHWRTAHSRPQCTLSDESVLHLLLSLSIEVSGDEQRARAAYATLQQKHANAPAFDDLVRTGWVRLVWGRVQSGFNIRHALRNADADTREAVGPLLQGSRRFVVDAAACDDKSLASTIEMMRTAPAEVHQLACPDPEWVISRLWERAKIEPNLTRLRFWVDRCSLVSPCYISPSRAWDRIAAEAFRSSAFEVLSTDGALLGWNDLRQRLIAQGGLMSGVATSELEARLPMVPSTLVDRYRWLTDPGWEHVRDELDTCSELWLLVNFLLCDIEPVDQSTAPHPVAHRLLELAAERPELLGFVVLRIQEMPVLLADMLLEPRFSALASMLIAQWSPTGSAPDYDPKGDDDRAARLRVFSDAMIVVTHFVGTGALAPAELASLLSWLHGQIGARRLVNQEGPVDEQTLAVARIELARLTPEVLLEVCASCITPHLGLGTSPFAAALDVVSIGTLADRIAPDPLIEAYVESIRAGHYSLSAAAVSASGARALVQIAARCESARRQEFLRPRDVRDSLRQGLDAGENRYMLADSIARSLRSHISVLCRAIAAWEDAPPSDVLEALLDAVRAGALSHTEKGRVAAFSVKYDVEPRVRRGTPCIADDLAEALATLQDRDRERLLDAILETDEPALLAQLVIGAPTAVKHRIRDRIEGITPSYAGEVVSLPDLQMRIEKLLAANALEAAARFADLERELETLGKVPGRELVRLRVDMRIQLAREDFDNIAHATVPHGLPQAELKEAHDIIAFYQALSEHLRPGGDLSAAERAFKSLYDAHRDVVAYGVNLVAVRVSRLLGDNLFGFIRGDSARDARRVLAEADTVAERWLNISDENLVIHNCNKSLLFLATRQPERAYEALSALPISHLQDRVSAYFAVALDRMGQRSRALEALDRAQVDFGDTQILRLARWQILKGVPVDQRATPAVGEDFTEAIKAALCHFSALDAMGQAAVLRGPPDAFDRLVIDHVRAAAAHIVELVPMMKVVQIDSYEDDLTALVHALLSARFDFLQWSLADQSRGGFSAKGNPGKRDLVLKKGTVTLAVLEAVACDRPITHQWTLDELKSHFQKLFSYSNCRLFFHLTYSYLDDAAAVLDELRGIAKQDPPTGFAFKQLEEHPREDSRPAAVSAIYSSALGDVRVVFVPLDLAQEVQRNAASIAAGSNARKKRGPKPNSARKKRGSRPN